MQNEMIKVDSIKIIMDHGKSSLTWIDWQITNDARKLNQDQFQDMDHPRKINSFPWD